jgi:double-strand break repair protein MRE11
VSFIFLKENDASLQGKGRKRGASRGRGRGSTQSSKRGRKSDNSTINRMLGNKDDDDDDDDVAKRLNKSQPRVGFSFFHFYFLFFWVVSSIYI